MSLYTIDKLERVNGLLDGFPEIDNDFEFNVFNRHSRIKVAVPIYCQIIFCLLDVCAFSYIVINVILYYFF